MCVCVGEGAMSQGLCKVLMGCMAGVHGPTASAELLVVGVAGLCVCVLSLNC